MTLTNRTSKSDLIFAAVLGLILILGFVTMGYVVSLKGDSNKQAATGQDLVVQQARSDCIRSLTQVQTDVVRARDSIGWQELVAVAERDDPTVATLTPKLRANNQAVAALPALQDLVNGTCPKVTGGTTADSTP